MTRVSVIDSHTGGEPTRVVIDGAPDLGPGTIAQRLAVFRDRHDRFRSAIVNEPRGSDVLVGALVLEPHDPAYLCGVIFFNNVGVLAMCGHGTIGVVGTLAHLGRIAPGTHRIETCVGIVSAQLHDDGRVSVENVASHRAHRGIEALGCRGDIAWGGNWFYLLENHGLEISLKNVDALTDLAWRLRQHLNTHGHPEVDHVELFGPPTVPGAQSKNFVLCPGKAWDRSPCGTGTSAKIACLAEDGKLRPGETWIQESLIGSTFAASYRRDGDLIMPTIEGRAHVNMEAAVLIDEDDPFAWGIRAGVG